METSNPRSFYSTGDKLFAGTYTGVYVLTANDNSWKRITNGMPDEMLITSIVSFGSHLFAGASMLYAGGVFHSADGGASWKGARHSGWAHL